MEITIPGTGILDIQDILLDYNGTLAVDGILIPGVKNTLNELSQNYTIHVITADTFGCAESELLGTNCRFTVISPQNQSQAKLEYLLKTGRENTAAVGNGRNDRLMLKESALGIAVIQNEGIFTETLLASDIVCTDILDALELFRKTRRLTATMRE